MSSEDTVNRIMTAPVKTINAHETLGSAAETMVMNEIGAVVVVENNKPIGIITERDIVKHAVGAGDLLKRPTKELFAKNIITVGPRTTIQDAFATMLKNKIRRLPVVDESKLVGIVTEKDLLRWALRVCYEPNLPPHIKAILDPC